VLFACIAHRAVFNIEDIERDRLLVFAFCVVLLYCALWLV